MTRNPESFRGKHCGVRRRGGRRGVCGGEVDSSLGVDSTAYLVPRGQPGEWAIISTDRRPLLRGAGPGLPDGAILLVNLHLRASNRRPRRLGPYPIASRGPMSNSRKRYWHDRGCAASSIPGKWPGFFGDHPRKFRIGAHRTSRPELKVAFARPRYHSSR